MVKHYNWLKSISLVWLTCWVSHINALTLTSSVFADNQTIPARYTCAGQDISPPLAWQNPIQGTQAYVLILDDPDAPAGDWTHWLLYSIPSTIQALPPAVVAARQSLKEGQNSWGTQGYRGPCPPSGTHRYIFTLYALEQPIPLDAGLTYRQLLDLIKRHVIGSAHLTGIVSSDSVTLPRK